MSETSSERNEQRRKLLKRAAVAPGIFLLPTGSALAVTSLTCVQKGAPGPADMVEDPLPGGPPDAQFPQTPAPTDKWVRKYQETIQGEVRVSGNYLQYVDNDYVPVAGASCWNSMIPGGNAQPGSNLIP
jgi:hypothetical protein